MADTRQTAEESFAESLKDVVLIIQKLAPLCGDFDEMVGMLELALNNPAQLRLLMKEVTSQGKR